MKILATTFSEGDHIKVLEAMRRLPYERLVLIGDKCMAESESCKKIRAFEELSGHEAEIELVEGQNFMELVDEVSSILEKHSKDAESGDRTDLVVNISGGSKLLGDAALFAAFSLGVEACHCDQKLTRLPIIKGATAIDRFTPTQIRFIGLLGDELLPLDEIASQLDAQSRQAAERVMRELRKLGLLKTEVRGGKIHVALSDSGGEVSRALKRQEAR